MKRDSRLSVALHILIHLGDAESPITSEVFARQAESNAVVMRRTMAGLRRAGIVRSEKGHGGGWTLARPLDEITLGDVYAALGTPTVFALGVRDESPGCLVERAVNDAVGAALADAEALLMKRLHTLTLAKLARSVRGTGTKRKHR
ncbi:MAG: Rrf2 family transcriptional regulator [Labilithrix sp.]|nr:Rrf2 family transcriptional regulator [Labilithrix sp.]MCW5813187.1 Rrf2 family transcriptional regulator [Labilithrix sp.]